KDRVVLINGGSKAYSMTGWRIGWALGPDKLIKSMADYQSQSTGSASSISQYAVLAALQECDADIEGVNQKLNQRKSAALEQFKRIPEFKISEPTGAFYFWVNVKSLFGKKYEDITIENDKMLSAILLEKYYVATVPGIECGNQGYLRLSFATSTEKMNEAIDRMVSFISVLK
ncbi:MAG: aminotransferase class I/II-fold pyridoxal phosphate-dependent enzyme, partial [Bdellovibrionales bacterium]|nr:aminotransferase class I/II-fold pyridoxal phosphate-dependent enzyme [Bdellovibrionales bacterium]